MAGAGAGGLLSEPDLHATALPPRVSRLLIAMMVGGILLAVTGVVSA